MKGNVSSKDGMQSVVDFPSLLPVRCVETCSGDVSSRRCSSQAWRLLPRMIRAAEIARTTHPRDALNPNNINTKCYCTCKFQCYYRLGSFWSRIEHFWVVEELAWDHPKPVVPAAIDVPRKIVEVGLT